jgi:hypothetical protein
MLWFHKQKDSVRAAPLAKNKTTKTIPDKTVIVPTAPAQFESPEIHGVYRIWAEKRGERAMPTREELLPRPLARYLRNISLVRVIPETQDYEMRIIGDAHAEAYGWTSQGLKLSRMRPSAPEMVDMLKDSYELVRTFRLPIGFRGILGRDLTQAKFDWFETLYLPLGHDGVVDHVLNASVYRPKDGEWPH